MKQINVCEIETSPAYNSWPMIASAGERLICLYSVGKAHDIWEPFRKVCVRYSDDGGIHWSPAADVVNSPDRGDVPIGKGNDGNGSALFWVRCAGAEGFRHELYRTADGIAYQKIAVFCGDPNPVQITDIFPVPGIGLMALWFAGRYELDACHNAWGTLVSTDNGLTWQQRTVEKDLLRADWPTEISAVRLDGERILAIARTENLSEGHRQFQLQSVDCGRTWIRKTTNIDDVAQSTPSLIFEPAAGMVYCYYYQRGAGLLKCRKAHIGAVWDNPCCWPDPEILYQGSQAEYHAGNVNVCVWKDRHAAAFYSGISTQTDVLMLSIPAVS